MRPRRKIGPRARVFFPNSLLPSRIRSRRLLNPPRKRRKRKRLKLPRQLLRKLPMKINRPRVRATQLRMLVSPLLRLPKRKMHLLLLMP